MANAQSDFVDVQLSAAGIQAAGKAALRITVARMSYQFKAGARVRVLTSEWAKILSRETRQGQPIFELAPAVVKGAAAGTPAAAQLKTLQAEEATLQTQVTQEGK